ncbi:TetR/AcrR family transcriptional regulator [Paenibacillus puerhi]|uniref:TetR/AcrR family transcriptional regulator n=1 Tax=Paenibacillus puerhi TaxID=2692622 RepID=UPI00135A8E34|nr:TetR family transcriptional regulator [Paenibacillus puerhi]
MAPKTKFTKESIVSAAFEVAREEGIDHITIRKIAAKLGSSIAPIYVNFTDVEEVKQEVLTYIQRLSQQMLMTAYSPDPFLNIGIASLKFARQYPVLFKDLVMNTNRFVKDVQQPPGSLIDQMKQAPELVGFTDEELMDIFFKMQVFQMGISVMDVNGLLPEEADEEKLIKLLESTGKDIITAARMHKNNKSII